MKKGFTLIELMIVVAIIGIVMALAEERLGTRPVRRYVVGGKAVSCRGMVVQQCGVWLWDCEGGASVRCARDVQEGP